MTPYNGPVSTPAMTSRINEPVGFSDAATATASCSRWRRRRWKRAAASSDTTTHTACNTPPTTPSYPSPESSTSASTSVRSCSEECRPLSSCRTAPTSRPYFSQRQHRHFAPSPSPVWTIFTSLLLLSPSLLIIGTQLADAGKATEVEIDWSPTSEL